MDKIHVADAIAKAFEQAPVPMVPQIATAVDTILSAIEANHQIDLAAERSFVQEVATAKDPWQQVYARATGTPVPPPAA